MSQFANIRGAVKTALGGLTSGAFTLQAAKVIKGFVPREAGASSLYDSVKAAPAEPLTVIGPVSRASVDDLGYGSAEFAVDVYLYKSKGSTLELIDVDTLCEDIMTRLRDRSYYEAVPVQWPNEIMLAGWTWNVQNCDGLLILSFIIRFPDP